MPYMRGVSDFVFLRVIELENKKYLWGGSESPRCTCWYIEVLSELKNKADAVFYTVLLIMQPDALFYFIVLIVSIIVHEVAHGYAANALGDPTARLAGRLTLNPIPHIDVLGSIIVPILGVLSPGHFLFGWAKPVPYNPYNLKNQRWGEFLVAGAGVATNLFLAVVFGLATRFLLADGMDTQAQATAIIALVNLFLGLFNLIPLPPLDGYTVLRGLLPHRYAMSFREFEMRIAQGGIITLIAFLFLFSYVFSAPFGAFVSYLFYILTGQNAW